MPQPAGDWHRETALGAVEQGLRYVPLQQRAQDPLTPAIFQMQGGRNAPGRRCDVRVEERHASLKRHRHRCAIHLYQNVVGKIAASVCVHHLRDRVSRLRASPRSHLVISLRPRAWPSLVGPNDHPWWPEARHCRIQLGQRLRAP